MVSATMPLDVSPIVWHSSCPAASPSHDGECWMRSSRTAQSADVTSRTASSSSERSPLASPEELSAYLGIPLGTLYSWNHRGIGPKATKVGRHLRYRWQEVEAWLDAQTTDHDVA